MPILPLIIKAVTSATRALPLVRSIREMISPNKISVKLPGDNPSAEMEVKVDNSPFIQKVVMLILEGASVYGIIWSAKKLGVTYDDIINLFGLIHK